MLAVVASIKKAGYPRVSGFLRIRARPFYMECLLGFFQQLLQLLNFALVLGNLRFASFDQFFYFFVLQLGHGGTPFPDGLYCIYKA